MVLDLKIYYSPDRDTFDAEDLAQGRVKVERIKELLRYCPNLEVRCVSNSHFKEIRV